MKRSGFASRVYEREVRAPLVPLVSCRGVYATSSDIVLAAPKGAPIQSEAYMVVVRKFKCIHCGIQGYTQFAHADMDKGIGIKSDCRLGYPACGPHPRADGALNPGCHHLIGTQRIYAKPLRHTIEADFGRRTRATVLALKLWPKRLPLWSAEA